MASTPGYVELLAVIGQAEAAARRYASMAVAGTKAARAAFDQCHSDESAHGLEASLAEQRDALQSQVEALAAEAVERAQSLADAQRRRALADGRPKVLVRLRCEQAVVRLRWRRIEELIGDLQARIGPTPARMLPAGEN